MRERGTCELASFHAFGCSGRLQAAHGFSRRYLGVRYEPSNGFALCAAAHIYWTHRPLEWDDLLRRRWGRARYAKLRRAALSFSGRLDYAAVLAALSPSSAELAA